MSNTSTHTVVAVAVTVGRKCWMSMLLIFVFNMFQFLCLRIAPIISYDASEMLVLNGGDEGSALIACARAPSRWSRKSAGICRRTPSAGSIHHFPAA